MADIARPSVRSISAVDFLFLKGDAAELDCVAPVALGLSTHTVDCGVTCPIVAPGPAILDAVPFAAIELFATAVAEAARPSLAVLRLL